MHSLIGSTVSSPSRNLAGGSTNTTSEKLGSIGTATTGLYDLWLNSMLPAVGPSMVTGVTSSSSHQINSERLAEKLMELSINESVRGIVEAWT
jgi:hypothetical protein